MTSMSQSDKRDRKLSRDLGDPFTFCLIILYINKFNQYLVNLIKIIDLYYSLFINSWIHDKRFQTTHAKVYIGSTSRVREANVYFCNVFCAPNFDIHAHFWYYIISLLAKRLMKKKLCHIWVCIYSFSLIYRLAFLFWISHLYRLVTI